MDTATVGPIFTTARNQRHTVVRTGRLGRNQSLRDIGEDRVGIAGIGVAPAAAAWRTEDDEAVGRWAQDVNLADFPLVLAGRSERDARALARLSTAPPPWLEVEALQATSSHPRAGEEHANRILDPHSTAKPPRPRRIWPQPIELDQERHVTLKNLRGDIAVEPGNEVHAVCAVAISPGARAADERLYGADMFPSRDKVRNGNQQNRPLAGADGRYALRQCARERTLHHVGHTKEGGLSGAARCAGRWIEQRPLGNRHAHRPHHTRVVGDR